MSDPRGFKPGSRPGNSPPPANAAAQKQAVPGADLSNKTGSSRVGRVVHDERGNAIWDWLKDTARIAIDSTSRLLKKLEVPELKLEDTRKELRIESDREQGGGYDPYGRGPADRGRTPAKGSPRAGIGSSSIARGRSPGKDPGGGYDPYGKGVTRKPTR